MGKNNVTVGVKMQKKEIYLDNSATTKICEKSLAAFVDVAQNLYANPESLHKKGFESEKVINNAKKNIALKINCDASEIYFTSGATESNNLAIFGIIKAHERKGKKIITTAIEHSTVSECFKTLKNLGYDVVELLPDEFGNYTPSQIAQEVDENTVLVSTMMVNNEIGSILPVHDIAYAIKNKNKSCFFHVDAVQAFMRLPIKLKNSNIDLMSFSGHKIGAPKGVGALYIKKGVRITPLLYGGGQQNAIRVGTQSPELVASFEAAVLDKADKMSQNIRYYENLRQHFYDCAEKRDYIKLNKKDNTVPYIINITVSGLKSEVLIHYLERHNIYVSGGSACSKGARSHVLTAMGLSVKDIDCALRISFCTENTKEDINELFDKLDLAKKELISI